jgi:hypothetical protein
MRSPPLNEFEVAFGARRPGCSVHARVILLRDSEGTGQVGPERSRRQCHHSPRRTDVAQQDRCDPRVWLSIEEWVLRKAIDEDFPQDIVRKVAYWALS